MVLIRHLRRAFPSSFSSSPAPPLLDSDGADLHVAQFQTGRLPSATLRKSRVRGAHVAMGEPRLSAEFFIDLSITSSPYLPQQPGDPPSTSDVSPFCKTLKPYVAISAHDASNPHSPKISAPFQIGNGRGAVLLINTIREDNWP